ncbi:MAG: hypothetical protein LBF08_05635 [Dysgonamonadaceae bacterium]|nr:hypothetical protein [Dysgonamonadaceae bacterium]
MYSTNKERIKELKSWAKKHLSGKTVYYKDLGKYIYFTNTGIKEYLNQPHKHYYEKNELIKNIETIISKSIYQGSKPYKHINKGIVYSHILETEIAGDKSWLIVRENNVGVIQFYGISDSKNVLTDIKKIYR